MTLDDRAIAILRQNDQGGYTLPRMGFIRINGIGTVPLQHGDLCPLIQSGVGQNSKPCSGTMGRWNGAPHLVPSH